MTHQPLNLRKRYKTNVTLGSYGHKTETLTPDSNGELISSITDNGMHMPVLDLDIPHLYLQSSTAGHGHLYLDVPMTKRQYKKFLKMLYKRGIIEHGYYKQFKQNKMNTVRIPGLKK